MTTKRQSTPSTLTHLLHRVNQQEEKIAALEQEVEYFVSRISALLEKMK